MINIDYLDTLPFKESLIRSNSSKDNLEKYYKKRYKNKDIYRISKFLIKKYLNKSFNQAFSDFCYAYKDLKFQSIFLKHFMNYRDLAHRGVWVTKYYIDNDYIIRSIEDSKRGKFPKKIKSSNYNIRLVSRDSFTCWPKYYSSIQCIPSWRKEYFKTEIVQVEEKIFYSPTREYYKWRAEYNKRMRKEKRLMKYTSYKFISDSLLNSAYSLNGRISLIAHLSLPGIIAVWKKTTGNCTLWPEMMTRKTSLISFGD